MHLQWPTRSSTSTSPTKEPLLHQCNVVARFLLLLITALTVATTITSTTALARAYQCSTTTSSFLLSRRPKSLRSSFRPSPRLWLSANTMSSKSKSKSKDTAAVDTTATASMSTSTDLLESWASHTNVSFHHFSSTEATEIREALLTWYVEQRRKLPWRGDPPPWQGSTAKKVVAENLQKKKTPGSNDKGKQKQMQEFFVVRKEKTPSKLSVTDTTTTAENPENIETAFPVTAYGVWVSEIMLQQTRVEAVIPYWIKWMKVFPTVQDLAAADPETVNAMWAGLGFYRRARLLQQAACVVTNELAGVLPDTVDGLLKLPGIGPYTASAIASIACNVTVPVVDGNVCRVLSRLKGIANHIKAPKLKDVWGWTLAKQIVEAGDGSCAGQVNQALMELGATYCAPSGTGIEDGDPLRDYYWSTRLGREVAQAAETAAGMHNTLERFKTCAQDAASTEESCPVCASNGVVDALELLSNNIAEEFDATPSIDIAASKCGHAVFPLAPPKMAKREEVLAVAVMSYEVATTGTEKAWLLVRRPKNGLLAGQWEFPSACVWTSDADKNLSKTGKRKDMSKEVPVISTSTRRKALNSLLKEVTSDVEGELLHDLSACKRSNTGGESLEHIFSHVRHTMWIEHASFSVQDMGQTEWVDGKDRQVRWMFESDMQKVGVTSGVKKVLKAVKKVQETSTVNKRQRRR